MWECQCLASFVPNFCWYFPLSPLEKFPEHQWVTQCANISANVPEHSLPVCEWACVRAAKSSSFFRISSDVYAAFHLLLTIAQHSTTISKIAQRYISFIISCLPQFHPREHISSRKPHAVKRVISNNGKFWTKLSIFCQIFWSHVKMASAHIYIDFVLANTTGAFISCQGV